jgi:hypothetical protein
MGNVLAEPRSPQSPVGIIQTSQRPSCSGRQGVANSTGSCGTAGTHLGVEHISAILQRVGVALLRGAVARGNA